MVMLNILGFMKIDVGKARLLLGVLVKITLKHIHHENVRYIESKERLCKVCLQYREVHHLQSCYNSVYD